MKRLSWIDLGGNRQWMQQKALGISSIQKGRRAIMASGLQVFGGVLGLGAS